LLSALSSLNLNSALCHCVVFFSRHCTIEALLFTREYNWVYFQGQGGGSGGMYPVMYWHSILANRNNPSHFMFYVIIVVYLQQEFI